MSASSRRLATQSLAKKESWSAKLYARGSHIIAEAVGSERLFRISTVLLPEIVTAAKKPWSQHVHLATERIKITVLLGSCFVQPTMLQVDARDQHKGKNCTQTANKSIGVRPGLFLVLDGAQAHSVSSC